MERGVAYRTHSFQMRLSCTDVDDWVGTKPQDFQCCSGRQNHLNMVIEMCEIGHENMKLFRYFLGPDSDDRRGKSSREMRMEEGKEEQYSFLQPKDTGNLGPSSRLFRLQDLMMLFD